MEWEYGEQENEGKPRSMIPTTISDPHVPGSFVTVTNTEYRAKYLGYEKQAICTAVLSKFWFILSRMDGSVNTIPCHIIPLRYPAS